MLQIIINAVFKVIAFIGGLIMSPIVAIIQVFVPDFSQFINGILQFFESMCGYVPFVLRLLMIPNFCLSAIALLFTSYVTFKLGFASYQLILKLYNKFKP